MNFKDDNSRPSSRIKRLSAPISNNTRNNTNENQQIVLPGGTGGLNSENVSQQIITGPLAMMNGTTSEITQDNNPNNMQIFEP